MNQRKESNFYRMYDYYRVPLMMIGTVIATVLILVGAAM